MTCSTLWIKRSREKKSRDCCEWQQLNFNMFHLTANFYLDEWFQFNHLFVVATQQISQNRIGKGLWMKHKHHKDYGVCNVSRTIYKRQETKQRHCIWCARWSICEYTHKTCYTQNMLDFWLIHQNESNSKRAQWWIMLVIKMTDKQSQPFIYRSDNKWMHFFLPQNIFQFSFDFSFSFFFIPLHTRRESLKYFEYRRWGQNEISTVSLPFDTIRWVQPFATG